MLNIDMSTEREQRTTQTWTGTKLTDRPSDCASYACENVLLLFFYCSPPTTQLQELFYTHRLPYLTTAFPSVRDVVFVVVENLYTYIIISLYTRLSLPYDILLKRIQCVYHTEDTLRMILIFFPHTSRSKCQKQFYYYNCQIQNSLQDKNNCKIC